MLTYSDPCHDPDMLHRDLIRGHLAPAAWALHAACFVYRSAECCGVITQLKLKVSRLLSPGPDRLTSTNQAMKYSPGQEVRKCETGRDKEGVMKDNKRVACTKKLVCVYKSLLSPNIIGWSLLLTSTFCLPGACMGTIQSQENGTVQP